MTFHQFQIRSTPRAARLPVLSLLAAVFFALVCPTRAAFDPAGLCPVQERRLLVDAADSRLDDHSLIEATLIAAGQTNRAALAGHLATFDTLAAQLDAGLDRTLPVADQARAIHAWLHRNVLKHYRTDASDVAETFETGDYNCVSASVLFVALAQRQGLNARAVQLPEHVRCEVLSEDLAIPVEMTTLSARTGRNNRGTVRPLNEVTLLATIYYNRGVVAFDQGDLPRAIEFNTRATDLDPDCRPARENLLAAINNRVVELMNQQQPQQALALLERGLQIDPEYRPLVVNRAYLLKQSR